MSLRTVLAATIFSFVETRPFRVMLVAHVVFVIRLALESRELVYRRRCSRPSGHVGCSAS